MSLLVFMVKVLDLEEVAETKPWLILTLGTLAATDTVLVETHLKFFTFFPLGTFLISALRSLFSSLIFLTVSSRLHDF